LYLNNTQKSSELSC